MLIILSTVEGGVIRIMFCHHTNEPYITEWASNQHFAVLQN